MKLIKIIYYNITKNSLANRLNNERRLGYKKFGD